MTRTVLEKILSEIGYEEDEKKIVKETVGMMRRFKTLTKETLKECGVMNTGMIDELMVVKEWYPLWSTNMDATSKSIKEAFTQALWDEFLYEKEKAMYEAAEKRRQVKEEEAEEDKPPAAAKTRITKDNGINVSYKVETKEIPKLPANKCQAKVADILDKKYVTPDTTSKEYKLLKTKDAILKNHLLTATMGSNASSFINVKTMAGVKMYNTLLDIFQGLEHDKDTVVNATAV
eukprot:511617-Ditylum_brightwellii.AAC.2